MSKKLEEAMVARDRGESADSGLSQEECNTLEAWEAQGEALRSLLTAQADGVDASRALGEIEKRIAAPPTTRAWLGLSLGGWMAIATATILGVASAPLIGNWLGHSGEPVGNMYEAVHLETLEFKGEQTPAILNGRDGRTTVIWLPTKEVP